MLRIAATLLLLATFSTANAQEFSSNEKSARLWAGSTGIVAKFEGPTGEAAMNGSWIETGLSYQFTNNFFGELSYTKNSVESVEFNGETTNMDDSWSSKAIGIGYRSTRTEFVGNYFGAAYHHDMSGDDSVNTRGLISLFLEKDNGRRFGRFGLTRATNNTSGITIGGTHVWFLKSGLGLGFDWSYESGENDQVFDTEVRYVETTGGLLLMYRL